jgi:hypothetical protein
MRLAKRDLAGGIEGYDEMSLQTGGIEGFHADQPLEHLCPQPGQGRGAGAAEKIVQSLVHRPGLLCGLGQTVQIVQHLAAAGIEFEIELPATAELEQVQANAPPDQKPSVVDDERLEARIANPIQPAVELGPEMADAQNQSFAEIYGRPARRLRS